MNHQKQRLETGYIEEQLRNSYFNETKVKNKAIRFPSAFKIFDLGSNSLEIHADRKSITTNMQTNVNAIDSWAIILSRWLGKKIVITWSIPSKQSDDMDLHYRRFLYRLENLPITKEIVLSDKMNAEIQKYSVYQIKEKLLINYGDPELRNAPYNQTQLKTENDFELFFYNHPDSLSKISSFENVFRQFPVGLFKKSAEKDNELFPARSAAIDILLEDKNKIIVVELKRPGNKSVGVISELLFYCYFIRDAIKGNFHFSAENPFSWNVNNVSGCLLLNENELHPLIDQKILDYVGRDILKSGLPIQSHFYRVSKGEGSCEIL